MVLSYMYRLIIPIGCRYQISQIRSERKYRILVDKMKRDYQNKRYDDTYKQEMTYIIQSGKYNVIPYEWTEEYKAREIKVLFDKSCNMNYVIHNKKRLYFPRGFSKPFIQSYYCSLLIEQDKRSPHRYFSDITADEKSVFVDVGAAEGIVSLDLVDKVGKVIMLECDKRWKDALEKTFEHYKEKVEIVPMFAGNVNEKNVCKLDSLLDKKEFADSRFILKMDVEGSEREVLEGAKKNSDSQIEIRVCLYLS